MKHRAGIRQKVVIIICLSTLSVMFVAVAIGYLLGFKLSHGMMGNVHRKLAQQLSVQVGKIVDEEITKIIACSGDPSLAKLRSLADSDKNIATFSIEPKILPINGDLFIGPMEFDETPNRWVIPVFVPIRNENKTVTGTIKVELAAQRLFESLGDFRLDTTGRAVLVNGKGMLMFYPGKAQLNLPVCEEADYRRLLTSNGKYGVVRGRGRGSAGPVFMAFSEVNSRFLSENDTTWRVFIEQDSREVFAPFNRFILWVIPAVIFLIIIMVPIGFIFSSFIVNPIRQLHRAVGQIMNGHWDYNIEVRTGDEIEEFADAFNEMMADIKDKQKTLQTARNNLEDLSKGLEKKVMERTSELTAAKNDLDRYARKLEQALMIKSDFISMASHEMRTPLTIIKEGIAVISEGKVGDITQKQREFLNITNKNVDRLTRLINDILDMQKLEQGKVVFKMEMNVINKAVDEVAGTLKAMAEIKRLTFSVSLEKSLPLIYF
ncbi:MAG: HAMP domain-containing protein, partial [Candidatus Omnitrophica bacterium]|nr:HAMP domain-containing protein [Candidatus Omnitrophota bacterium]